MGVSLGNAFGKITIDASGATAGTKQAQGALSGFQNAAQGVGGVIQGILGAQIIQRVTGAMMEFGKSIVSEAVEAQNVQTQLAAVLKSTGGAAGVSAEQANQLADSLSKTTRFGDEAILSGENILLTFTKVGKDIFPLATQTALDMSQALGQDLKTSNTQLGKALQDPINGITALRRVGVNFTDSQELLIKSLVQAGKVEEAQKMILSELQTEFGGSAQAAGKTFAGQLDILKTRLGNVKEAIGGLALRALSNLMERAGEPLNNLTDGFIELLNGNPDEGIHAVGEAVGGFSRMLGFGQIQTRLFQGVVTNLLGAVASGKSPLEALGSAMRALMPAGARSLFDGLMGSVGGLGKAFQDSLPMLQSFGRDMWGFLAQTVQTVGPQLVSGIQGVITTITQIWRDHGAEIMAVINFLWRMIVTIVGGALTLLVSVIQGGMTFIRGIMDAISAALAGDWQGAWEAIKGAASGAFLMIWEGIVNFFSLILTAAGTNLAAFTLAFQTGLTNVKLAISTGFNSALTWIRGKISEFVSVGSAIIAALVGAITSGISGVVKAITGLVQSAIDTAMDILDINSPSRVFAGIGHGVTEGMVNGLRAGVPDVLRGVAAMARQMADVPMPTLSAALAPASASLSAQAGLVGGAGQAGWQRVVEVNNYAPQYHTYQGRDEDLYRKYYSRQG